MKGNSHEKSSRNPGDWHRADVVAELRKKGYSLRALSRKHGYQPTVLSYALSKPWPKAEKIIAAALGKKPYEIWPSRYSNGKPNRRSGARSSAL